jgi:hypothetical protein
MKDVTKMSADEVQDVLDNLEEHDAMVIEFLECFVPKKMAYGTYYWMIGILTSSMASKLDREELTGRIDKANGRIKDIRSMLDRDILGREKE